MSTNLVSIDSLPQELSNDEAMELVYREELDKIEDKLRQGLSVLVECDKQLTLFMYKAIRSRLKRRSADEQLRCRLISGHVVQDEGSAVGAMQTRMQRILNELQECIFSGITNQILVLPHLDVLTTTTRSSLNLETREAAALLYENPESVFLGFKDPSFELPKVIENVFAVRYSLIGIPRNKLPCVILQREARKFGVAEFNPYRLYKYVSGLNAIRFRQIMAHFSNRVDYDPATPESVEEIYHDIRQMTLVSDLDIPKVDLDEDIGGYGKVKDQIKTEILELLKIKEESTDPETIQRIEEIVPKGMIFYGPPGTGKTFFAKAIATALDATINIVSGPELKSKWVGESEENLRRVFSQARKSAPSIIVFDELDSFAAARGTYTGSGVEHSMVNQLLTEMDGFRKEELVFIVGTTNFMESLDPALLRPGRFELSIKIPFPNPEDRKEIFKVYKDKFNLDVSEEVTDYLVQKTGGFVDERRSSRFTGDHIYAIARALKREELRQGDGQLEVTEEEVNKAISVRRKKPVKLKAKEERTIAIHEAGHAICAYVLPNSPKIEKITIATGEEDALGYVMRSVRENKYVTTQSELLDDICVLLGGRVAESKIIGEISIGSYDDLQRASELSRMMVEELGMGKQLGLRTYTNNEQHVVELGAKRRPISDGLAARIDEEINQILDEQLKIAEGLVDQYRAELDKMVELLMEKKTLGPEDVKEIFGGRNFKNSSSEDEEDKASDDKDAS
ncbi:MAG TPA: ATP-binding protein [Myxococcales bacterium]|nr:ATP-binding protein [Deltaproteobacteria bacterium]MBU54076.1 ATP-binding protein [Deltaproteobacteria bacterium]HAA58327.1 ATP-binding protein [Myxococcales bacterium]|tara:strand:- start:15377 stop:17590 length:2214 start_codon:yes stop_codon:yes gene_type:complete